MKDVIHLIDSKKPGITELDIKLTEEKLNVDLPEQYKELFKLSNNAQIGEWTLFPIKDSKNLKRTWDDIVRENIDIKDEGMSEELISIGEDGTGDKLCFRNAGRVCDNRIYIWYHETRRIEEIASSLKEFVISYSGEVEEDK
ncbi:SMI1/KNR4 family protein [Guptibacillus hwajinpoensis]|uniref:SMI1/KNR4 family protein n=1 Tax=Guptibacillus hwajinpoensis TaxID=208199 RepID=UPI001CFCBC1F|nr:SMI1/KNR4 family protein [Pseudalkalibacillus hwajinpoensis]WLR58850.1 SMI1/KNR4 family protein [Pseudalkalibacillus hwajinpoensis]